MLMPCQIGHIRYKNCSDHSRATAQGIQATASTKNAAQVAMGATLGARMTRDFVLGSRRLALAALFSALGLSVLLTVVAVALGRLAGLPVTAVVLGMAPGGMPEMAVTAKALDLAVPLVLTFHLTRTILCNLLVGPIWRAALALRLVR